MGNLSQRPGVSAPTGGLLADDENSNNRGMRDKGSDNIPTSANRTRRTADMVVRTILRDFWLVEEKEDHDEVREAGNGMEMQGHFQG